MNHRLAFHIPHVAYINGDFYPIPYAEFEEASAPLKLAKKGERPLRRPQRQEFEKQAFDKEEDEPMPVFLEGNSRLKGFEIDFNGEIVRGAVPTGAGVYISSQIECNMMVPCNLCKHLLHKFAIWIFCCKFCHVFKISYRITCRIRKCKFNIFCKVFYKLISPSFIFVYN